MDLDYNALTSLLAEASRNQMINRPGFRNQQGRWTPFNYDQMVVGPYGLPPDRNSFLPDPLMQEYFDQSRQERL